MIFPFRRSLFLPEEYDRGRQGESRRSTPEAMDKKNEYETRVSETTTLKSPK